MPRALCRRQERGTQTVLFPGGPLKLRIFDPRYLDMVSRCMREESGFGVSLREACSILAELLQRAFEQIGGLDAGEAARYDDAG